MDRKTDRYDELLRLFNNKVMDLNAIRELLIREGQRFTKENYWDKELQKEVQSIIDANITLQISWDLDIIIRREREIKKEK